MTQVDLFSTMNNWSNLSWFGSNLQRALEIFLDGLDEMGKRYCPARENIFKAFDLTPFNEVSVVILGQDPYPSPRNAMGLAFSVPDAVVYPPSLMNIFKEMEDDIGCCPESGNLEPWAKQGVLLLNVVLTCSVGISASHKELGWENLTLEAIHSLIKYRRDIVFICWGANAKNTVSTASQGFFKANGHLMLSSVHPSPISAHNGFFGSKHFSKTNEYLVKVGKKPIEWC